MRGKLPLLQHVLNGERIIPAHAGQTPAMPHRAGSSPDHPRACGANFAALGGPWGIAGSSPRMRGKHICVPEDFFHKRIIPAHAGQTVSFVAVGVICTDHPRACGANCFGGCLAR